MYSPKISEDLIPRLYRLAKKKKTKMTTLVNRFIREKLDEQKTKGGDKHDDAGD